MTAELSCIVVHVSPDTLQPAIEDRVGDEVVFLDQDTNVLIGYGRVVASGRKGVRVQTDKNFPSTFFDLEFSTLADNFGIWFNPLDGLPPTEFEEQEIARYKNTKVRTRVWYEIELKADEAKRKIMTAILGRYQPHCIVTLHHLHQCASDVMRGTAGGMIFSQAIGELLTKGFFRLNYDDLNRETTFIRR